MQSGVHYVGGVERGVVLKVGQGRLWGLSEVIKCEVRGRSDCKELAIDVNSSCSNANTKLERHGRDV